MRRFLLNSLDTYIDRIRKNFMSSFFQKISIKVNDHAQSAVIARHKRT